MTKTKKTAAKAKQNRKMVPESEAMASLKYLAHQVIFGNETTRMMLLSYLNSLPEGANADEIVDCILTCFAEDNPWREDMLEKLEGNEVAEEIYFLVSDMREELNLDALDRFFSVMDEIHDLEEEAKSLLAPNASSPEEEVSDK